MAWLAHARVILENGWIHEPQRISLKGGIPHQVEAQVVLSPLRSSSADHPDAVLILFLESFDEAAGRDALLHAVHASQVAARYEVMQALRQREQETQGIAQAMLLLDAVNRESRFRPAVIGLCNQAADTWKAFRVSVGFLAGQTLKLRGMSHTEDISRKMQVVQDLEAAMEECIDQDMEVLAPQPGSATTINRQLRRYAEKHGPCRVCVLPLRLHDRVIGAMAVEWASDHEIDSDEVEAARLATNLFTARLHQFHLDDRWFGARFAASLRRGAGVMVGPKHTWAKLTAIVVVAFLASAFLFEGDDTVDSGFTVQTTSRQVITAPFAGTLLSVGEGVEVNEPIFGSDQPGANPTVLALMDTSELRVELAAVVAEIADYRAQADAARGQSDLAGVEVALANVRRLQAQADLYDYRIKRSTLTSPVSGVLIEGDLRQRINGVLEKGEVLFEVAPLETLRAELEVPASRVGDLRSRLEHPENPSRGELASVSHPGEFIGFTVERIEPVAEVVDGQNIFRVRVALDEVTDWLRPGVEGEAKVRVGRRSYAYLWTREAVNWIRMKLWF
ncbi:MAG: HlyD family efflux transporter periplasmic adaptor subunit [Planctomycetota bacterium]